MSDNSTATITTRLPDSHESSIYRYPPSLRCLVCEKLENPNADIVDLGKAWLCDRCKNRLRELIGIEVTDDA